MRSLDGIPEASLSFLTLDGGEVEGDDRVLVGFRGVRRQKPRALRGRRHAGYVLYSHIILELYMHTTNLRRVGGSVMLAVPPALLDLLKLGAGAKVDIGIENGRLIVAPRTRPSYSLDELLAQCDENAPVDDGDRAWLEAKPVGNELL